MGAHFRVVERDAFLCSAISNPWNWTLQPLANLFFPAPFPLEAFSHAAITA